MIRPMTTGIWLGYEYLFVPFSAEDKSQMFAGFYVQCEQNISGFWV